MTGCSTFCGFRKGGGVRAEKFWCGTIEELWSKAKQYLRRAAARSRGTLYDVLGEALELVTFKDILGWFQHAGLCATHG